MITLDSSPGSEGRALVSSALTSKLSYSQNKSNQNNLEDPTMKYFMILMSVIFTIMTVHAQGDSQLCARPA